MNEFATKTLWDAYEALREKGDGSNLDFMHTLKRVAEDQIYKDQPGMPTWIEYLTWIRNRLVDKYEMEDSHVVIRLDGFIEGQKTWIDDKHQRLPFLRH